jgi:hypothetical protein
VLKGAWNQWRTFWFEPVSPLPVCIYRIFVGLLILQIVLVHAMPALTFWYGPYGIIPIADVQKYKWNGEPRLDALLLFPASDQGVYLFFALFVLVTIFFTVGFLTRHSAILVALGMISMHHHQPFNSNGGDAFLRIAIILMCFTDCGRYWSVDNSLRKWFKVPEPPELSNPWAQRLLQVQFAIVYWQSFCWKILGPQWQNGTAVYYATRLDDMLRLDLPILNNLIVLKLLTWYTLLAEFSMFTFVWFKEFRYYVLLGVLLLHFGIDLVINLPVFEWTFIGTLIVFVEPSDLKKVISSVQNEFSNMLLAQSVSWSERARRELG